ncbi:MAG: single-stranded-DNA-specific exonuclease RecJ [Parcubacteria group bacterium]|nr:MAG: single-stranded-DNA-specific exonuclease RecJ [Parcubacteria group bacterium]
MQYIWNISDSAPKETIEEFPELDPIVVQLLYNRGLKTQEKIDEFFNSDYSQDIHDPYLFKGMSQAVARLYQAIKNRELVTVYGDYDADGVCAATILNIVLTKLGAKVNAYLPHREREGYGLNSKAVEEIAGTGAKVIVTCDCGISNIEEIALARAKGIDVIITDHHSLPERLPEAYAIIHPQVPGETYPFKFLAGGGVAFKLAQALLLSPECVMTMSEKEGQEKWLLDLVSISTVADIVPLLGENRTLLKYGLIVLKKTRNKGLQQMIDQAGLDPDKMDPRAISFSIAPRINAAGRMDHANLAYYLLREEDEVKAAQLARDLNQSNIDRQNLTETVIKEAQALAIDFTDSLLAFYKPSWPAGLTGLVASRLMKIYNRPCLILTDNNGNIVASGRSLKGFNVTKVLQESKDLLIKFGGHPQACGFSVTKENMPIIINKLKEAARAYLNQDDLRPTMDADLEIDFSSISWELVDALEQFKPFGMANEEPVFVSRGLKVAGARKVGSDGKHWKLDLNKDSKTFGAIAFNLAGTDLKLDDIIDIAYNLSINEWNGNREIQIKIKDIHPVRNP